MPTRFPKPGDLFEDRYQIESVIGVGGFANVYGATQIDLGRTVAIKVLSRVLTGEEDSTHDRDRAESASRRFKREARLVSQLRDPNTITIFDYGETADGLLYIVFERIDGRSLKEIVQAEGPIEPPRVVEVLKSVLSSLEEAHAVGILHRDIKPANIMLYDHVGRESVKLLDFGIAKVGRQGLDSTANSAELTRDGALVGTPRYMAPEQIRDEGVSAGSDLFSLGLVAYEMLTGEQANPGTDPVMVIGRHLDDRPFTLPWRDDIPIGLRTAVHGLLEKDPAIRFGSAVEARAALEHWEDSEATDSTLDITFHDVELDRVETPEAESDEREPVPAGGHGRGWVLLFAVIAILCVVTVAMLASNDRKPREPTPASQAEPIVVAVEATPAAPAPAKSDETKKPTTAATTDTAAPEPAPVQHHEVAPADVRVAKPRHEDVAPTPAAAQVEVPLEAKAKEKKPPPAPRESSFFSVDDAL